MKIAQKYSHLNGEEYLIVHHNNLYDEIKNVIESVDADNFKTKISKEKTKKGKKLYSPKRINKFIEERFIQRNWQESRYNYFITLNRDLMEKSISLPSKEQKKFLIESGEHDPIFHINRPILLKIKLPLKYNLENIHL